MSDFLGSSPADVLSPYSIVVTVNEPPEDTLILSDRCWEAGIPLIAVKSNGYIGSVRTQMQEVHCKHTLGPMYQPAEDLPVVVETHPDHGATLDLRLDHPFPSLAKHAASIDFASLNSHDYAHIPAIVILLQALQAWKDSHDGALPRNYEEKNQFRKSIHAMKRGGSGADHENFEEAVDMVMKAVKPTVVPDHLQKLFKEPQCDQVTAAVRFVLSTVMLCLIPALASSLHHFGCYYAQSATLFIRLRPTRELSSYRLRARCQT